VILDTPRPKNSERGRPGCHHRVSAIIVNYESYAELANCLEALQPQVRAGLEVIVVDQGSQPDQATSIAARFPWVRLVQRDNAGFAAGVNRGAAIARGEYLLLLNPDAIIGEDAIPQLCGWLDTHLTVAVVGPRILNEDGSLQWSARRFPDVTTAIAGRNSWLTRVRPGNWLSRRNVGATSATEPTETDWVSGACMMVRHDAFEAVGGMDEGYFLYWEDADLCRRLKNVGWRTTYWPGVRVVHSGGRSSQTSPFGAALAFHRSAYRYYLKHGGLVAKIAAPAVGLALLLRLLTTVLALRVRRATSRRPLAERLP
jgi:GT2 family glycosyltransferase